MILFFDCNDLWLFSVYKQNYYIIYSIHSKLLIYNSDLFMMWRMSGEFCYFHLYIYFIIIINTYVRYYANVFSKANYNIIFVWINLKLFSISRCCLYRLFGHFIIVCTYAKLYFDAISSYFDYYANSLYLWMNVIIILFVINSVWL